jgi:DNA-binding LytR/AlgR family response regulator
VKPPFVEGIPVRRRDEVLIVPVHQIASIVVAEGELLHLRTAAGVLHTINDRLKEVEAGLDPAKFIRLGRGTFANVDLITKLAMMPGGGHIAVLTTEQS